MYQREHAHTAIYISWPTKRESGRKDAKTSAQGTKLYPFRSRATEFKDLNIVMCALTRHLLSWIVRGLGRSGGFLGLVNAGGNV